MSFPEQTRQFAILADGVEILGGDDYPALITEANNSGVRITQGCAGGRGDHPHPSGLNDRVVAGSGQIDRQHAEFPFGLGRRLIADHGNLRARPEAYRTRRRN